jgi:Ca-activated chloride channel homolog
MTFAHPHLLWFLLIVPALVGLKLLVDMHGSKAERLFTAARLRPALVMGRSLWRSWLVYTFYTVAMACIIVAVAQPRWGEEKLETPDKGRNIFIAIDTSRSMLARDVPPDRLTRARLAAHDLVMELNGERVGLLAFAGRAYLQAPLTTDHDAIIESLLAFDHTIIEWGGSNLADLLDVTLRAVKSLPKSNYALVIFSDGGDADADLVPYIQRLTTAGVVVVTVGVGTENGMLIPNPEAEGDYIRDEAGNVVRSQLQSGVLRQLASATGGRFLRLGDQPLNRHSIQPVLDRLTEQQSANRQTSRPIERFAWPLGLGIVLLMLAWIISALPRPATRPVVLALAVAAFAPAPPVHAAEAGGTLAAIFTSSGPTPEDARKALESGDYRRARELYAELLDDYTDKLESDGPKSEAGGKPGWVTGILKSISRRMSGNQKLTDELTYGMATTEHDLTNYDASVRYFSELLRTQDKTLRARAHRGMGHTLYDQGVRGLQQQPKITLQRWTDAQRHLDAALELEPDNKDLHENRDHVAKELAQLRLVIKQMEEQQGKKGQKGQKGDKGQKGQKGAKGEGQEGEEGDEGDPGQGSDTNNQGEPKELKERKGEKKEADDGIGGKDAKELPEGRLQAAGDPGNQEGQQGKDGQKPGGGGDEKKPVKGNPSDQRNPRTGYTPAEAADIIRQYMDDITALPINRYHTPNKKDW